jgi:phage portal protein BeeE
MGKRKGRAKGASVELAERHDFSHGILGHDAGEYHVNVSERTALGIDAVFACVTRLADAISGADVGEWRCTDRLPDSRLTRAPMASMFRGDWLWQITAILALYTSCYLWKRGRDSDGVALSLEPLIPSRITKVNDRLLLDGVHDINPRDLIRVRRAVWPTLSEDTGSLLRLAREVFAAAWAQGAYTADFWESGGAPSVIISTDQAITSTDADDIRDRWVDARVNNPGAPAVVGKGANAKVFGVDLSTAGEAASDRLLASVARFLGVQPWLVNAASAAGSMVYTNTEGAGLDLVRYTLSGYRRPIEDAWSSALPGDYLMGRRIRLGLDHLTLPGFLERAQAYQIATGGKPWMRPDEVRPMYGLPPDAALTLDPAGTPAPALESIGG